MTPMWQFYDGKQRSWQYSEVTIEFPEGTLVQECLSIGGQPPSLPQVQGWGWVSPYMVKVHVNKFKHVRGCP